MCGFSSVAILLSCRGCYNEFIESEFIASEFTESRFMKTETEDEDNWPVKEQFPEKKGIVQNTD